MTEPESVRWVRYAADCAERVLPLTGDGRPQAEAAIKAARAWADCPCEEHEESADAAARTVRTTRIVDSAIHAVDAATKTATSATGDTTRAVRDAEMAASYARRAIEDAEKEWQTRRLQLYGATVVASGQTGREL